MSNENVRFFTGVQRVITPIWATAKSGLQVMIPLVTAKFARPPQIKAVPLDP